MKRNQPAGPFRSSCLETEIESARAAFNEHGLLVLVSDASRILGVSNQRVARLLASGSLTSVSVFGRVMVPMRDVIRRRDNPPRVGFYVRKKVA